MFINRSFLLRRRRRIRTVSWPRRFSIIENEGCFSFAHLRRGQNHRATTAGGQSGVTAASRTALLIYSQVACATVLRYHRVRQGHAALLGLIRTATSLMQSPWSPAFSCRHARRWASDRRCRARGNRWARPKWPRPLGVGLQQEIGAVCSW